MDETSDTIKVTVTEACDDSCPFRLNLLLYLRWLGSELKKPVLKEEPVDTGSVIHEVLERTNAAIAGKIAEGKVLEPGIKQSLVKQAYEEARKAIENERGESIKVTLDDVNVHVKKLESIEKPEDLASDNVYIERERMYGVNLPGNIHIVGKIDEIQNIQGKLKVIDIKTGKYKHDHHVKQVQIYGEILQAIFSDLDPLTMELELQYSNPAIPEEESIVPVEVTRLKWLPALVDRFCIAKLYTKERALGIVDSTCELNKCGHCEILGIEQIRELLKI